MKFMLLIYADPTAGPDYSSAEGQAEMADWYNYTNELAGTGALVAGEALQDVSTATTVRQRDGKTLHTDGPFAETKEVLGGFYMVDFPSIDDALAWAAKMPNIAYGSVEVRPIQEFPDAPTS